MNKRKKVKFLDPVSAPIERVQSPSVFDAKTSEYKCFRRLLHGNDRKRHFNQICKDDNNLKKIEVGSFMQDKNDLVSCVSDAKRSLFPIQNVTPNAQRSPSARIPKNFELDNESKYKHNTCNPLTPDRKVISDSWRLSLSPGPKNEYEGIFSKKRKDLLGMAAETSSHKVYEILSNKSELILEYLQRLGVGPKSGNFDELSKPEKKVSSGRCHPPASLKSYGDNKELQVAVKGKFQPAMERKWEMGLLKPRCGEADELIALPVDQALLNSYALEANFQCHKWQPISVFDDKRKSNLYAKNKTTSTADLEGYKASGHMIVNGDELITLPQDYHVIKGFPTFDALDSGLQSIKWHSNPTIVDEEFFENRSAHIGYGAMCHMLPKMNVLSPRNHAIDRMFSKADKIASLPSDAMLQSLPARHAIELGTEFEYHNEFSSAIELGTEFEYHNEFSSEDHMLLKFEYHNEFSSEDHMLSKFDCRILDNIPYKGQFEEQSVVPYSSSAFSNDISGQDLYAEHAKEQCAIPLLECPKKHPKGLDCLPLTVYTVPDLFDRTGLVSSDVYKRKNEFSSLSSSSPLSTRSYIDLESENCWSIYSKHQFDEEQVDGGLGCIDARIRFEDCENGKNFVNVRSHLPDAYSSLGLQFSMNRERSIFSSLPEQLSWHYP